MCFAAMTRQRWSEFNVVAVSPHVATCREGCFVGYPNWEHVGSTVGVGPPFWIVGCTFPTNREGSHVVFALASFWCCICGVSCKPSRQFYPVCVNRHTNLFLQLIIYEFNNWIYLYIYLSNRLTIFTDIIKYN